MIETVKKYLCLYGLPVLVVLLIGGIHLPDPFTGDQAGFMIGAKELDLGGTYYIDFWDNKQPGIYLFYWLAGSLFGFTEIGVHTLELLIYCIFTIIIIFSLRHYFNYPWMSSFVPITTIGFYYLMTSAWSLTQLEILVSFPLFMCAWLSSVNGKNRNWQAARWFFSGASASVAVIFKLVLAPIPIAMWLIVIFLRLRSKDRLVLPSVMRDVGAAILGGILILILIAIWFASNDALFELWHTTFVYPIRALVDVHTASLKRLFTSAYWFGKYLPFLLVLSFIGLGNRRVIEQEAITYQMVSWIISGIVVILVQRFSYWQYHFVLFIFPIGVLSIRGIDAVLTKYSISNVLTGHKVNPIVLASCLVLFATSLAIPTWENKAQSILKEYFRGTSIIKEYPFKASNRYSKIRSRTQFLKEEGSEGPIYVFGDPLYYFLTQRRPALPENAWGWEMFLPDQWNALIPKLKAAQPIYIYIDEFYYDWITKFNPDIYLFINDYYYEFSKNKNGVWYRLHKSSS